MHPLTYFEQIVKMKGKADKFDLRLRMVKHALVHGVKPTARVFSTSCLKLLRESMAGGVSIR